jgi:hypothetical protein
MVVLSYASNGTVGASGTGKSGETGTLVIPASLTRFHAVTAFIGKTKSSPIVWSAQRLEFLPRCRAGAAPPDIPNAANSPNYGK